MSKKTLRRLVGDKMEKAAKPVKEHGIIAIFAANMVPTPPFPDYPAAHACSAGAAAAVLAGYIRPGERITLTSPATGIPAGSGETRHYPNLEAVKTSVANARVYAGVHFRRSSDAGAEIGDKVGRQVLQKFLKPTSKPS